MENFDHRSILVDSGTIVHWGGDRRSFHYDDVDTVASLSLSLYEGAAFKLLFPIGIQWSLVPPADSRGMGFLYRSVQSQFAFFWACRAVLLFVRLILKE